MKRISTFFIVAACAAGVSAQTPAVPAPKVERRVETRVTGPEAGVSYIGIEFRDINKDNFSQYGLSDIRGVAVDKVSENSPAAKGGLQKGDVIVRFDGDKVSSARKLQRLVAEVAPDHQVRITVVRGGKETDIDVTVGRRPAPMTTGALTFEGMPGLILPDIQVMPDGGGEFNLRIPRGGDLPGTDGGNVERTVIVRTGARQIGVEFDPINKQLGEYFGVADGKGLLVKEVREGSPAAKAGLKAGDVITAVDGKSVSESGDLIEAVNEKKEGEVTLTFYRNKKKETVKVLPEAVKDGGTERRIERIVIGGPVS